MKPTGAQNRWRYSTCIYRSTGHNIATVGCVPQRQLVRSRVEKSEANAQATNAVIHRPECLITDLAISFGDPQLTSSIHANH